MHGRRRVWHKSCYYCVAVKGLKVGLVDTIFAPTIGTALSNAVFEASNAQNGINSTDLSITFDSAIDPRGPGFRVQWKNVTTGVINWWNGVAIGMPDAPWPLLFVIGTSSASFQTNAKFAGVVRGVEAWAEQTRQAMEECVTTMCGADTLMSDVATYTNPGRTDPWVAIAHMIFATPYQIGQWQCAMLSTLSGAVGAGNYAVPGVLYATSSAVSNTFVVHESQSQADLPFDMDIAINNGANIFSVNSKTFTEP
jgi:hypothetical protein